MTTIINREPSLEPVDILWMRLWISCGSVVDKMWTKCMKCRSVHNLSTSVHSLIHSISTGWLGLDVLRFKGIYRLLKKLSTGNGMPYYYDGELKPLVELEGVTLFFRGGRKHHG